MRPRAHWAGCDGLPTLARALALAVLTITGSCTGTVGSAGPAPGGGPGGTVTPVGPGGAGSGGGAGSQNPAAPPTVSAAVAPMRRLTQVQYVNTVRDLLGVQNALDPTTDLPGDDSIQDRFPSNTVSPLQTIDVGKYSDAADKISQLAAANLATLLPCDPKVAGEAACAKSFIAAFGQRAYRRPLTQAEADLMQTVYQAGGDFPTGIRLVIAGILQSPKFLYLFEPVPTNAAGKIVGVNGWAMASRLSYFLLNTMPDDGLFKAAAAGQLATADQVTGQAMRLMNDPRFGDTMAAFHQDWLQLGTLAGTQKDPQLFPDWTTALRDAMGEETRRFVSYVFTTGDKTLGTLLSAPFSLMSGPLYQEYGLPAAGAAGAWQQVNLPAGQRAGILTQASVLSTLAHENRTSFILRGKMVREALFCEAPLVPPPDVPAEPMVDPNASAKQRSAAHRKDPACASCHDLFDPIGFAFEIYDAMGRYRTMDGAGPIDSTVTLTHTQGLDGKTAKDAVELVKILSTADEVRDCMARQWMRFALGRDDAMEDQPSLTVATGVFKASGGKLPDLLGSVVRSDAFRYQKVDQ